jgi:hypothetical protein
MKKGLFGVIGVLMALAAVCFAAKLPIKTDVKLKFAQKVSSKTAKVGDLVKLEVAEDEKADGKIVLAKGTPVTGVIMNADKKGSFGKNARIRLAFKPVKSRYGDMIFLAPRQEGKIVGGKKTTQAGAAAAGGAVLLGPVGLLGGLFIEGKEVSIKPGDTIESEVVEKDPEAVQHMKDKAKK